MTRGAWRPAPGLLAGVMLALSPLWTSDVLLQPSGLTVGRLFILAIGAAVLVALWRRPLPVLRAGPGRAAFIALVAALALVTGSAVTNGCLCDGAAYGFAEYVAVVVLVAAAVVLAPRVTPTAILAGAAAGAVALAVLALAGIGQIGVPLGSSVSSEGRLSGSLGNPNLLGMYLSLVAPLLPLGLQRAQGWQRLALCAVALPVVIALLQTYSRSGLLATLAGTLVAVAVVHRVRVRDRRTLVAWSAGLVLVGVSAAALFNHLRTDTSFHSGLVEARAIDRGGWDARAQGPIPAGPSQLSNRGPSVLVLTLNRPGEGASIALAPGPAGARYRVEFDARADSAYMPIGYAIQDNDRAAPVMRRLSGAISSARGRRFVVSWRAPFDVEEPRFYVWALSSRGTISLLRVAVADPGHRVLTPTSLRLQGSTVSEVRAEAAAEERRAIGSRQAVLNESLRVFAHHPLTGIGWQRFPQHARVALAGNGAYATHNEYTRFMAELGVVGVALLLTLLGAVALAVRRIEQRWLRGALAGMLASGAVNLLFTNALAQPAASLPLAAAMGVAIGLSGTRAGAARIEA